MGITYINTQILNYMEVYKNKGGLMIYYRLGYKKRV